MPQAELQAAIIVAQHGIETAFEPSAPTRLALVFLRLTQDFGGQHGRECQRHKRRSEDRDGYHDGELVKDATDDASHQQNRYEHSDQRYRDRHDGETDLATSL